MKKLANLLVVISILLVIYFLIAKFTGPEIIEWRMLKARATPGLILATFLMLIAIFLKLSVREEKGFIIRSLSKRRILFLVISLVITGVFLRLLWFYDQNVIERFHQIYCYSGVIDQTRWLGIRSVQIPCDNWAMQEIIYEVKPDFIIETGTYEGGTALFYATVLEKVNKDGKVITIDIDPRVEEASKYDIFKERVEVIKGDSVSLEVIDKIAERVKNHKVLVTLDSLHTKEHVLKELSLYSKLVSLNSYIVVQDTAYVNQIAFYAREGPMEAVKEFLKTNKNFKIDHDREKFILTFYPSGYLKRIK